MRQRIHKKLTTSSFLLLSPLLRLPLIPMQFWWSVAVFFVKGLQNPRTGIM
ncbi:unnamed protein product [Hymenolepis diminuta]|uniref:Uncharacterized protein n=1 Tax=Hymenolepis diminuta TaxID=6216 RepID=A0A564Y148_HYMDI|nr:unnamed protein product [Hymenolepis diminuta]